MPTWREEENNPNAAIADEGYSAINKHLSSMFFLCLDGDSYFSPHTIQSICDQLEICITNDKDYADQSAKLCTFLRDEPQYLVDILDHMKAGLFLDEDTADRSFPASVPLDLMHWEDSLDPPLFRPTERRTIKPS